MKKFFTKEMGMKIAASALAVVVMGASATAATFNFQVPTILNEVLKMMMFAFMAIGIMTIIFGAVQMGFAFKNDDADGKTKGMRAALSGAIVFAVGFAGQSFFTGNWWLG